MFRKRILIIVGIFLLGVFAWVGFSSNVKEEKKASSTGGTEAAGAGKQGAAESQSLYTKALALKQDRKLVEAKELYKQIMSDYPDFEDIEKAEKDLEEINMEIILSNTPAPSAVIHEVQPGDTLGELAKKYGTTVELIKLSNHLKSDVIRVNQRLRMWTGKFDIYVDKSQNILILKSDGEIVKVYHVSTGTENSTPVGTFKVTTKLEDPVWFNRGVVVPPESPENVLGTRWLGFDIPGYGIHGTIEPDTIGQQVTAGCVRMRNNEVEELYSIIPLGTEVIVVD